MHGEVSTLPEQVHTRLGLPGQLRLRHRRQVDQRRPGELREIFNQHEQVGAHRQLELEAVLNARHRL